MSSEGYEKLMDLWIVRGFIHKGTPEEKWGIDGDKRLCSQTSSALLIEKRIIKIVLSSLSRFFMTDIRQLIAKEFSLPLRNIKNALDLWQEGATIPFLARNSKSEYKLSQ